MIVINEEYVEADCYMSSVTKAGNTVYMVKISFTEIGLYMSGITVQNSIKFPDKGLWVQPPHYSARGKWVWPIEYSRGSPFRELVESHALEAVSKYQETANDIEQPRTKKNDTVLSGAELEEAMSKPITLDDVDIWVS